MGLRLPLVAFLVVALVDFLGLVDFSFRLLVAQPFLAAADLLADSAALLAASVLGAAAMLPIKESDFFCAADGFLRRRRFGAEVLFAATLLRFGAAALFAGFRRRLRLGAAVFAATLLRRLGAGFAFLFLVLAAFLPAATLFGLFRLVVVEVVLRRRRRVTAIFSILPVLLDPPALFLLR